MRTKEEILKRIEELEYESGQLLDRMEEEKDMYELHELQDMRDEIRLKIEQLHWVLKMKVHTDLKELLEDFAMTHSAVINICGITPDYEEFVKYYLSSNSLALGKPEPLSKNKQTDNICDACLKPIRMKNNTLQLLCECDLKSM